MGDSNATTMDFFGYQESARRRTWLLVVLLILAVVVIVAAVYPVFALLIALVPYGGGEERDPDWEAMWQLMWEPWMVVAVSLGVVVLIGGAAVYKIVELARGGGGKLAQKLGGQLVTRETEDPGERRVLNVVEEMAIASGIPAPPVYVMPSEGGINAFAAGTTPERAVIGVTRGALERLSRDELQGVIAHEFSHIFNGDMRVNIRLIGVIHGLTVLTVIGYGMIQAGAASGSRRVSRSRDDRGGGLVLVVLGAVVVVLGMLGVLFGRLIKAAISRQREFLADAAAVQFTRNPDGLAGALKKIGGHHRGARLSSGHAEEASHMFFGRGVRAWFLLDTHPGLPKRIQRIDPRWDGTFPEVKLPEEERQRIAEKHAKLTGGKARPELAEQPMAGAGIPGMGLPGIEGNEAAGQALGAGVLAGAATAGGARGSAVEQIGKPTAEHLAYAQKLRESIPEAVEKAAHQTGGGRAMVYALLLSSDREVRARQLERLRAKAEREAWELTEELAPQVEALGDEVRLPLIDLALPALRSLSAGQYETFKANMEALIKADRRVSVFEWMLRHVVRHHLDPVLAGAKKPRVRYYGLGRLGEPISMLLSTLAYVGAEDVEQAREMYAAGIGRLEDVKRTAMREREECGLEGLGEAIETLRATSPRERQKLITACAVCIATNERVTVREAELLRAISDAFDAPMPPLLPGQPLS